MDTQIQAEVKDVDDKKLRELKNENRRLKLELESMRDRLSSCEREIEALSKRIELFELVVNDLLTAYYQGRLKVDFNQLALCTSDRCIAFTRYEDLLSGLRTAILLVK